MKRLLLASIASLGTVFACVLTVAWIDALRADAWGLEMALVLAAAATLVALAVLVVWGLPVHWFLKSRNRESLLSYAVAGALPAVLLVPSLKPFGDDTVPHLMLQAFTLSVTGAVAALVFWKFLGGSDA
jgi:hypothetical protein